MGYEVEGAKVLKGAFQAMGKQKKDYNKLL